MKKTINLQTAAPWSEPDDVALDELNDAAFIDFGTASELTRGSGGRHGEASYPKP